MQGSVKANSKSHNLQSEESEVCLKGVIDERRRRPV